MSKDDKFLCAWWRRLSIESRMSMVGALAISFFLLFIEIVEAVTARTGSLGINAAHALLVVVVGWFFVQSVRRALGAPKPRGFTIGLLVLGAPVLTAVWVFDWTLGCVWVASTFLALPGGWALATFGLTIANAIAASLTFPGAIEQNFMHTVTLSLFAVFAVYVPIRLVVVLDQLVLSREEISRLRVDEERFRISRDLHDVLGRTLVAVSLREQAALCLLKRGRVQEASEQIRTVHEIVAEGQVNLRSLTQGPIIADLHSEIDSARELCARTGIDWDASVEEAGTPAAQNLVAAVIREAVTNMLKYSRPTRCWLGLRKEGGALALSFANDGCPTDLAPNLQGTGLRELRSLCEAMGGTLLADDNRSGIYSVRARIPILVSSGV